jgi:hypothetical protein
MVLGMTNPDTTVTTTTTVEQKGTGQLTTWDLGLFAQATIDLAPETTVKVEIDSRYDSDKRAMVYEGWTLTAIGAHTTPAVKR